MPLTTPSNADSPRIDVPGQPDPRQIELLRKSLEGVEQAPTTRDQSPSGVDWKRLSQQLGAPFDPTKVPLRKLREMREDPMISFALHYILVTQARADWHMEAKDANGPNPQVAAFMDAAWRQIHARYIMQHGGGTLSFGYQAIAKRFQLANPGGIYIDPLSGESKPAWDEGSVMPRIWKPFVALEPERATARFTETGPDEGDFDGIDLEISPAQRGKRRGVKTRSSKKGNQNTIEIDVFHSLWATNDRDSVFGNIYGRPRIRHAYRYWWSYWWRWGQYDRAFERMAVPPIVAYHPDGSWTDPESGEKIPYQTIALNAAERLRSNAIAAVPSTLASSGLDEKGTQKREWEFEFVEPKGGANFSHFDVAFNYLDVMKLRSIWVPEQAFIEGEGGTSSRNVAAQMAEIFLESQALLWEEIADHINRFILPQILLINFPEFVANGGTCRIMANGFKSQDTEFMKQLIQLAGQADASFLGEVDFREELRRMGVSMKSPEQYALERARISREQRLNGAPPPTNGGRGKLSVVPANPGQTNGGSMPEPATSMGFSDDGVYAYVAPRESIELTDTEEFIASLPATSHFDDRTMKALSMQMRRAWQSHFRNAYPDFAEHLETIESFSFADGDKRGVTKKSAIKAANKIVREWTISPDLIDTITERSRNIIERMVARGTRLAQKRSNIAADADNEAITTWVDGQVSKLIKRTSDTMKDEMHAFLVDKIYDGMAPREIAREVRHHFSDFNGWKADRVARSETRDAANAAVLMHGTAAGLKWVRMSDGEEFDKDCRERNGKLATIREAWNAMRKTHPNCTLGFDLIPRAQFSIDWRRTIPEVDGEERAAYFDEATDTAVVFSGLDDAEVESFFWDLGKALVDPRVLGKPKEEVPA